ncbi:hypothetical protein ACQP2X_39685 [Actinoplanes sp. CA-131856]
MPDQDDERRISEVEKQAFKALGDAIGKGSGDPTGVVAFAWRKALEAVAANPKRFSDNVGRYGQLPGTGHIMLWQRAHDTIGAERKELEDQG